MISLQRPQTLILIRQEEDTLFRFDFQRKRENEKNQVNRLCNYVTSKKVLNIQYYDVQIVSKQLHDLLTKIRAKDFIDVIMIRILALIS